MQYNTGFSILYSKYPNFRGTWNATGPLPTVSPVVAIYDFFIVTVAGTTLLGENSNWQVGDIAYYNGVTYIKNPIIASYGGTIDCSLPNVNDLFVTNNSFFICIKAGNLNSQNPNQPTINYVIGDIVLLRDGVYYQNPIFQSSLISGGTPTDGTDFRGCMLHVGSTALSAVAGVYQIVNVSILTFSKQKITLSIEVGKVLPIKILQVFTEGTTPNLILTGFQ